MSTAPPGDEGPIQPAAIVVATENPFPDSSLGGIGVTVRVHLPSGDRFGPETISVPYDSGRLGWVDAATLRLFHVDADGEYELVARSWVDTDRALVHGRVSRSGIYTVIGLPDDGPGRDVVRELRAAFRPGPDFERDFHLPHCRRITCLNPATSDLCTACLGLHIPRLKGLPEFELVDFVLEPPPVHGARLYAVASFKTSWPATGNDQYETHIDVVDTGTWDVIERISIDNYRAARAIAVSKTHLAVGTEGNYTVRLFDLRTGPPYPSADVALPETTPAGFVFGNVTNGCAFSPDGKTLWLSGQAFSPALRSIDVDMTNVAGSAEGIGFAIPSIRGSNWEQGHSVSISPTGDRVAIGETVWNAVGHVDLAARRPTLSSVQLGTRTAMYTHLDLAFSGPTELLVYSSRLDQTLLYQLDLTATSQPTVLANLPTAMAPITGAGIATTNRHVVVAQSQYGGSGCLYTLDRTTNTFDERQLTTMETSPVVDPTGAVILTADEGPLGRAWIARRDAATLAPLRPSKLSLFDGIAGTRDLCFLAFGP